MRKPSWFAVKLTFSCEIMRSEPSRQNVIHVHFCWKQTWSRKSLDMAGLKIALLSSGPGWPHQVRRVDPSTSSTSEFLFAFPNCIDMHTQCGHNSRIYQVQHNRNAKSRRGRARRCDRALIFQIMQSQEHTACLLAFPTEMLDTYMSRKRKTLKISAYAPMRSFGINLGKITSA